MLFALSILLLLQIFQTLLLEPFYKGTLHKDIVTMTDKMQETYFSDNKQAEITKQLNTLTTENNACIVIYNTKSKAAAAFDSLGEGGCAIYNSGKVNPVFIEELGKTESDHIYQIGNYLDLSTQQVMVYGRKFVHKDITYYLIANYALQSMTSVIRTTQTQLVYILLIVLVMSIVISILFSRFISTPIVNMTTEAQKMSYGNYDVHFNPSGFNEIDDLSNTMASAAKSIARLDETSREMIANVSHDIKTPLTMIRAYAEMIRDISGNNKKKRDQHLEIIIQETEHLDKLTTDMLELSRLKAEQVTINITSFDLQADIDKAIRGFRSITDNKGIIFETECEPELVAVGDENKICEVLYNFIGNAIKHVGDDNKVFIKANLLPKNMIRVEVTDHGPGIDENDIPYIWDRYYKSDRSYHRAQQGTGLGLAICKAILEEHKAVYGVNSKLGEGSSFYFEIPSVAIK